MADDQLLSLVVRAGGWRIDDFARDGQPLAVVWKGLPWPLEEILEREKSIIHSTKDHDGVREVDVGGSSRNTGPPLRGDTGGPPAA